MKSTHHAAQRFVLGLLGGAGYMAWVLQFLLLVALYFERLYHSSIGNAIFPTSNSDTKSLPEPIATPSFTLPDSGIFIVVAFAVGFVFIGLVVYVITRRYIPAVNHTAAKVVHETATQAVKQVEKVHHKKLPARKRSVLTAQVSLWLKICISLVPVIIVLTIAGAELIPKQVAILIVGALGLVAILCFVTQNLLAYVWLKAAQINEL